MRVMWMSESSRWTVHSCLIAMLIRLGSAPCGNHVGIRAFENRDNDNQYGRRVVNNENRFELF